LSQSQSIWKHQLTESYASHPSTAKLLSSLALKTPVNHFSLDQGIIKYKNRIWVATSVPLQHQILQALHPLAMGGP
jgi:hypothetical protein